tara:strand:+ start:305 stop:466 length:162 start_codon:yes stop_codon:yes gene_type:complete
MSLPKQKLDYVEELYDMYYQKLSDLGLPIREVILEAKKLTDLHFKGEPDDRAN